MQPGERILCRHPFMESKRVYVVPSRDEALYKCYWDGKSGKTQLQVWDCCVVVVQKNYPVAESLLYVLEKLFTPVVLLSLRAKGAIAFLVAAQETMLGSIGCNAYGPHASP